MKKIYLIVLLLVFQNYSSQNRKEIDSLIATPYEVIVSEPNSVIQKFRAAITSSEENDNKNNAAKLYSNLALAYSSIGELDKYREAQIKAIKLFEELNNEIELTSAYGSFGYHLRRTNIKQAIYYMQLAISLGEKNNLKKKLTAIYDNYGTIFEQLENADSALYYYEKGLDLKLALSDSIGIPYSLNHLAGIYANLGNLDKAFEIMHISDEYRAKEKSNYGRAENAVIFGELYAMAGKNKNAVKKFNKSIALAKTIGNKYMIQYNYKQLANIYENEKSYKKAFTNLKNYNSYRDSISSTEINEKIAQLEIKFETEKKDKEIAKAKLIMRDQKELIIYTVGLLIVLSIVLISIYLFQKYKRKQIKIEFELKNQLAEVEYENKISDEKLRISRELHDNTGSHLTFLISSLDNFTYIKNPANDFSKLKELSSFGRTALNELRQTIWVIKNRESSLDQLVLKINELKNHIISDIDIKVINKVSSEIILSSIQILNIYRIIQEALQNSIKYSKADKVDVVFADTDNGFNLLVKDYGIGFDTAEIKLGNGINNMRFRCEEIGGVFILDSNKGGTEIFCSFNIN
ncbi:MAG: hypothetical protein HND52_11405 [Ignavibacteriae bacterium]|nr:hypothetical protein [Ignavibacteriota bacterium]NOG98555.1 hypothetical protein [Ignavibacteriota bacterium]